MSIKEKIAGIGTVLLGLGAMIALFALGLALFYGAAWASAKLLPLFSTLALIAFFLVVFILLPLAIPRATRGFSSVAMLVASYLFGVTLWMHGLLLTLGIWGFWGVIIGLFLGGVGVVPIGMLATLLNGMWAELLLMVLLSIATYGSRLGSFSLAASLED